jgi:uncharacterized protein YfaS (alpha-2-macroglobulin family)
MAAMTRARVGIGVVLLALAGGRLVDGKPPPAKSPAAKSADPWKDVDKLVSEQKLEAASEAAAKLREEAKHAGDEAGWTKALVRETELRIALGGYETAVRSLKDQPWPKGTLPRVGLQLYYAQALVTYSAVYGWEIGQRERVDTKEAESRVDLKAWTQDQIFAAAVAAYDDVWKVREALGREPVARLSDVLIPNDYPPEVRGTLRDAVSYLFVNLLSNTQGWRPEQSNELFALDPLALWKGDPSASAKVKLADPAVHPLVRIGAMLDDLEAWHRGRKEADAALEARLTRARVLFANFTDGDVRDALIADLGRRLDGYKARPWWAEGQAVLAGFVESRGLPGAQIEAHALAAAGAKAFPDSIGGRRCRAIVARIEAPEYALAGMSSDGIGRRSLQITHRNLGAVHLRAYAIDLDAHLARAKDYNLLPDGDEMKRLLGTKPAAAWTVALPATPDYQHHLTFVTPPLDKPGLYAVVASVRPDFATANNLILGTNLLITGLVLANERSGGGAEGDGVSLNARVLDGAGGQPLAGVDVLMYRYDYNNGHKVVETRKTDGRGTVAFARARDGQQYFLVARRGRDRALDASFQSFWRPSPPTEQTSALVYTDRSIYRPLQKLFFKAVVFRGRGDEARYRVVADQAVTVKLLDANGQEVDKRALKTNAFGSVAGQFTLPAGRLLGGWSVQTDVGGHATVRVEEYKRPTFEVKLDEAKQGFRLNRPANVTGEARYYFGLPMTSGQVRWRVTREPIYPFWWGWRWGAPAVRTQTVASGVARLDGAGKFGFAFTPRAAEPAKTTAAGKSPPPSDEAAISYRYHVDADVTDEGGETRGADRSFRLGLVSVEARLDAGAGFLREGQAAKVKATRTDLDGTPRAGNGNWRLTELVQPAQPLLPADQPAPPRRGAATVETPGDKLRPRWDEGASRDETMRGWREGTQRGAGALAHDAKGEATIALPALAPGAYRLSYATTDDFGARYETATDLIVAGAKTPLALPAALIAESATVTVGGTARLLVQSGFDGQPILLQTWRAGKRTAERLLTAGKDGAVLELPIRDDDRGGFGVTMIVLRDHQLMTQNARIFVPWDDRELKVEVASFRDKLRPGAKETFKVTVRGPPSAKPEAAAAELLAYMYDRSLDLFAPHSPPSPMSLWPDRVTFAWVQSSLGQASGQWVSSADWGRLPSEPSLVGDRLKNTSGYGIGGPGRRRFRSMHKGEANEGDLEVPMPSPAAPAAAARAFEPIGGKVAAQANLRLDEDRDGTPDEKEKRVVAGSAGPAAPAVVPRANFAETAFWQPQLVTGPDGAATISFAVPDSVTSWSLWVHAISKTLLSGSVTKQAQSVKELMVRPNVPRFLREGDKADLKIVVNNAADRELAGELRFALADPDTGRDLAADFGLKPADLVRPFKVAKGSGTNVALALAAPRRVGMATLKVTAVAGNLSDGELRPMPILPSRVHLTQSRFVTLTNKERREMKFPEMAAPDPTRVNDQMVVSVDAQLFQTVLQALPFLVRYPYECTEQTLNRFLSTGIVTSVFKDHPAIAKLAKTFSARETPLATFDAADPNRKLALEESPWLNEAQGGKEPGVDYINVLDPKIAAAERASALAKLQKAQTALGGFPWFPGGPPDPYMTLYIMSGFARAAEFNVPIPKEMVTRGWQYLARHFREDYVRTFKKDDCCWEWLTFLNYVAGAYPDGSWTGNALTEAERKEILAFSFKHWKQHSPYLKGLLALTLSRAGRAKDAKLVWDSVMDSAKTRKDEGTFWAPEDRSWLWYNDTIETHAFALRTLMELDPKSDKREGLVLWLLLNKKLNQWKSTRATAEVIYALVHYLKKEGALGIRESARVTVAGKTTDMVFDPDVFVGKKQVVIPGSEVGPATSTVTVEKETKGFAFASATWSFSTEKLPAEGHGDFFSVSRHYFKRETGGREATLTPIKEGTKLAVGDELEVHISLRTKHAAEYVHLRDPRGAGFEPEHAVSGYRYDLGIFWYEETRDSGANFFFDHLPVGEYTFKYRVRASMAGTFRVGPATVQSMYAPEFNAYSAGAALTVGAAAP